MDVKVGKLYQRVFPGGYVDPENVVVVWAMGKVKEITTTIYFSYLYDDEHEIIGWDYKSFKEAMVEMK